MTKGERSTGFTVLLNKIFKTRIKDHESESWAKDTKINAVIEEVT